MRIRRWRHAPSSDLGTRTITVREVLSTYGGGPAGRHYNKADHCQDNLRILLCGRAPVFLSDPAPVCERESRPRQED